MKSFRKSLHQLLITFLYSSLAYQGYARGLGIDEVLSINEFAIGDMMPHVTVYFSIDPEEGLKRIYANGSREKNRLDLEKLDFHTKVQEGYQELMKRFPERFHSVDAGQSTFTLLYQLLGNRSQLNFFQRFIDHL